MPFHEKSAWIMIASLLLGGLLYFSAVLSGWSDANQLVSPKVPLIVGYTVCLTIIAVVGHIIIAVLAPRDANAPADERERLIFSRAGHFSSYLLATAIVLSLALYLVTGSGDLLFYCVFASLMLGQITEYVLQVIFYRTSL